MKVILAEKPKQAKEHYAASFKHSTLKNGYIEAYNVPTDKYYITWAIGHLLEIPTPDYFGEQYKKWDMENLPFFPKIVFNVKEDTKQQYEVVYKLLRDANEIIVGTDVDNEGENIAWSIIETIPNYKNKQIKRLWINSLEGEVVQNGLNNLLNGYDKYNNFLASRSRQISDYLIGMNYSQLFTLQIGKKGIKETFSVGRIQSPTLFLIYEREMAICNFKPSSFYTPKLTVSKGQHKIEFSSKLKFENRLELEKKFANYANKVFKNTLDKVLLEEKEEYAQKLHSLSTLQTYLNKEYNYSPSMTLKLVQSLYEKRLLSYPRTACNYITTAEYEYLKQSFNGYQALLGINTNVEITSHTPSKKYVADDKVLEHHALIPTKKIATQKEFEELSKDEKNVYKEVILNTLLTFMPPHVYNKTTLTKILNGIEFTATGRQIKELSWRSFRKVNEDVPLPDFNEGELVDLSLKIQEGKTQKPKRINEGQLISWMKNVRRRKNDDDELDGEDNEVLENESTLQFQLGTEATRADIIETLKKREYIRIERNNIVLTPKGEILCKAIDGTLLASPEMTAKWEMFLEKIASGERKSEQFIEGIKKSIEKMIIEVPLLIDEKLSSAEIAEVKNAAAIGECPLCKSGYLNPVKNGLFYACSNKECVQTFSSNILEKKISEVQLKKLISNGKTDVIKGFKGKKGAFNAYLTLDKKDTKFNYKLNFK